MLLAANDSIAAVVWVLTAGIFKWVTHLILLADQSIRKSLCFSYQVGLAQSAPCVLWFIFFIPSFAKGYFLMSSPAHQLWRVLIKENEMILCPVSRCVWGVTGSYCVLHWHNFLSSFFSPTKPGLERTGKWLPCCHPPKYLDDCNVIWELMQTWLTCCFHNCLLIPWMCIHFHLSQSALYTVWVVFLCGSGCFYVCRKGVIRLDSKLLRLSLIEGIVSVWSQSLSKANASQFRNECLLSQFIQYHQSCIILFQS